MCCLPIASSMASARLIARPRAHSTSNRSSPTRERRSSRSGVGGPSDLERQAAHALAHERRAGIQPSRKGRPSVGGGESRGHLERVCHSGLMAALTLDHEGLGKQRSRCLSVAGLEREEGQVGQGVRNAPGRGSSARADPANATAIGGDGRVTSPDTNSEFALGVRPRERCQSLGRLRKVVSRLHRHTEGSVRQETCEAP